METPFVKVRVTGRSGLKPIVGALITCTFTAPLPVILDSGFNSRTLAQETFEGDELVLSIPPSSYLASKGIDPPTPHFLCPELGIDHDVFIPDEDCELGDILNTDNPDFPVKPHVYRTATVWESGEGVPTLDIGREGDWYLDTLSNNAYKKGAEAWVYVTKLGSPDLIQLADVVGLSTALNAIANDLRWSNARTPTLHAASHATDGSDPLTLNKSQVGLSRVDNTNDVEKPVSTLTQAALDLKAPLVSPALSGVPTAPTAALGTSTNQIATMAAIKAAIDALIAGAPGALDTLNEIAAQLANDESAVAALTTTVAGKLTKTANLSDLADTPTARNNLGLGTAATRVAGTAAGQVNTNGAALVGSRVVETNVSGLFIDVVKATGYNLALGSTAGTVAEGNHTHDTRYGRLGVPNTWAETQTFASGAVMNLGANMGLTSTNDVRFTNFHIPRLSDLTNMIMLDHQDEFALLTRENRTAALTPAPDTGDANALFTDDANAAQWNTGTSPFPVVLDIDCTANLIPNRSNARVRMGVTFRSSFAPLVTIKLEISDSSAPDTYTTIYEGSTSNGVFLSPEFLLTGVLNLAKARVTFTSTNPLPGFFRIQRVMMYHPTHTWSPWHLHRLGGTVFGNTRFGASNVATPALMVDVANTRVGIGNAAPASALHVGGGSTLGTGIPSSVGAYGTLSIPQIYNVQTAGEAAVGLAVNDGVNNRRAKLFLDGSTGTWGLYYTYSTTNGGFVVSTGANEQLKIGQQGDTYLNYIDSTSAGVGQTLTLRRRTGAVPAVGFGNRFRFQLDSTTTKDQDAGSLDVVWADPTHATRTAYISENVTKNGVLTEVRRADHLDSAAQTNLMLRYNGTLVRVFVGAADSGGTGFRALRIAN
jgi:hypothetical protein